ncbi:MAG: TraB/GumN family protein, partial [Desulfobacterales bacterium]
MLFRTSKQKKLKMIWQVQKNGYVSKLVGTAHFFPYSFRNALRRRLLNARIVMFEGPLNEDSMARVRQAGMNAESSYHLFDELDDQTIAGISGALIPVCRMRNSTQFFQYCKDDLRETVYELVQGMQPWLAFFTLWSTYLQRNGWKYSVDMEAFRVAQELDKKIIFLESIEEQIKVLQNISHEKIIRFLKQTDQWETLANDYVKSYLKGDLEKLRLSGIRFPSRHHTVIDHRDKIFFERMQAELARGGVVAFLGAPHLKGMSRLLLADGYQVE